MEEILSFGGANGSETAHLNIFSIYVPKFNSKWYKSCIKGIVDGQ